MSKSTRIPAAAELIEAVAEFLEKELLPTLKGSKQFNTRVSINALRIVQRELRRQSDESVVTGLQKLLGAQSCHSEPFDYAQDRLREESGISFESLLLDLAERIRSGKMDENDPALLAVLRQHTLERLAVDNPKYSSYVAARERGE